MLGEACEAYQSTIQCGDVDAVVDLFDALLQRAELLEQGDYVKEAIAAYNSFIDMFVVMAGSDELPILEGLAVSFQRRAQLQKGVVKIDKTIKDLDEAIALQTRIAVNLIE